jgi:hypothetical protein
MATLGNACAIWDGKGSNACRPTLESTGGEGEREVACDNVPTHRVRGDGPAHMGAEACGAGYAQVAHPQAERDHTDSPPTHWKNSKNLVGQGSAQKEASWLPHF